MVKVEKAYQFHGPDASATLSLEDLFAGKDQLIVYNFMLPPGAARVCSGCACVAEHLPDVRHLRSRNTALVVVSRAPYAEIAESKAKLGWKFPWVSSYGSDFNRDFDATTADGREKPNLNVFYRKDGVVYHTYSIFADGVDSILTAYQLLDFTPLGRQDEAHNYADFKLNYEYDEDA